MPSLDDLNEYQNEAIQSKGVPLLVLAGAGTGKTKTLVHKLISLVEDGFHPREILLLTFSRRAAKEMLTRANALTKGKVGKIQGGTFHSFGFTFLRKYGINKGFSTDFSVLDEEDKIELIGIAKDSFGTRKSKTRFPKNETLSEIFSSSFNRQLSIEKIISKEFPMFLSLIKEIQEVKTEFARLKAKYNRLDFDDLLDFTRQILIEDEGIRKNVSERYKYILVDEYQDTNKVQAHISCLLASIHENIVVVGDDAQCIYGFRGSSVKNILDFPKIFPKTKIITLTKNYRSNKGILNIANSLISRAEESYKKVLVATKTSDVMPKLVYMESLQEEANFISDKILEFYESGQSLSEIAVLFRAGWQSNLLEVTLQSKGIPFQKFGGKKFLESSHIKDIFSYCKLIVNKRDVLSWKRVLSKEESIGKKTIELIILYLEKISFDIQKFESITPDSIGISEKNFSCVRSLVNLIDSSSKEDSSLVILEAVLAFYLPKFQEEYDDYEKRSADFETLKLLFQSHSHLSELLGELTLDPITFEESIDSEKKDLLVLSTIHSSKGLEWKTVFILQCTDSSIPSPRIQTKEELEEERRLFYVAITRAKSNLFFSCPTLSESRRITPLSRFLEELKKEKGLWEEEFWNEKIESKEKSKNPSENNRFTEIQNYFLN